MLQQHYSQSLATWHSERPNSCLDFTLIQHRKGRSKMLQQMENFILYVYNLIFSSHAGLSTSAFHL